MKAAPPLNGAIFLTSFSVELSNQDTLFCTEWLSPYTHIQGGAYHSPASAVTWKLQWRAELLQWMLNRGTDSSVYMETSLGGVSLYCSTGCCGDQLHNTDQWNILNPCIHSSIHKLPTPGDKDCVHWWNNQVNIAIDSDHKDTESVWKWIQIFVQTLMTWM